MEREFKWRASRADYDKLCALFAQAGDETVTDMRADYFDDAARTLRQQRIGLRLRSENGVSVCCMKLRGKENAADGLHAHAEFECPAETLAAGLAGLVQTGADAALCAALAESDLFPIARTDFRRLARLVTGEGFTAELSFDCGTLASGAQKKPFEEIELEFKSGDADAFQAAGETLARENALVPEALSKLARALQLSETEK